MTGVKYLAQDLTHRVLWLTTKSDDRKAVFTMVWFWGVGVSFLFSSILTAGTVINSAWLLCHYT